MLKLGQYIDLTEGYKMFERKLYCTTCGREIEDDEEIYAKMAAPKHKINVEIKAYLLNFRSSNQAGTP
jgi:hypothetical protein